MRTVYKYPIKLVDEQFISMPVDSEIIHVSLDPKGEPCIWAIVNTKARFSINMPIYVRGTGHDLDGMHNNAKHVGSFKDRMFVWHVFAGSDN